MGDNENKSREKHIYHTDDPHLFKHTTHNQFIDTLETNLEHDIDDFEIEGSRGDAPFKVHVIAGSVAGLMEHVLIFPIDTIKVNKLI